METIYLSLRAQVAVGTFFMKFPVAREDTLQLKNKCYDKNTLYMTYNVCLENGSDQLFVTLYKLSIYPSVHNKTIRAKPFSSHILFHAEHDFHNNKIIEFS